MADKILNIFKDTGFELFVFNNYIIQCIGKLIQLIMIIENVDSGHLSDLKADF
jgi:hypothetical protein